MFRATISMPDEIAKYVENPRKGVSEMVQDIVVDYQYALLDAGAEINKEERESLEADLEAEVFKVKRLFDAENNTEKSSAMVAIIEFKNFLFTEDMGIFCIDQFMQMSGLYKGRYFFRKCLSERMVKSYLNEEGIVELKEYKSYLEEADRLELKVCKDMVQEVFAYRRGELVDYFLEDTRVSTYKRRIERLTGTEWNEQKEKGNSDCVLIRKGRKNE